MVHDPYKQKTFVEVVYEGPKKLGPKESEKTTIKRKKSFCYTDQTASGYPQSDATFLQNSLRELVL